MKRTWIEKIVVCFKEVNGHYFEGNKGKLQKICLTIICARAWIVTGDLSNLREWQPLNRNSRLVRVAAV
jgi:hypothetical protein